MAGKNSIVNGKKVAGAYSQNSVRIGVDIGGTFTDFVVQNISTGKMSGLKIPTTPDDPSRAILDGLIQLQCDHLFQPLDTLDLMHAKTLATNTILEKAGARIGLITTTGFRDILEMRRETRYEDYDLAIEFPPPLVPRRLRLEV